MTPKQKLKSLEKKMDRISSANPIINFYEASRYFYDIERYYKLRQEHFHLEFEINHCQTCGKSFKL
jgi:hypothetical protein